MKNKNRIARKFRMIAIGAFAVILILGMLIGALFFIRPKTSTVEKRKLTAFPKFTMASMLNGSFFKDVSTWYADTYPGRDGLIAANNSFKGLYGIESSEKLVTKTKEKADEIPVEEDDDLTFEIPENVEAPKSSAVDEAVQDAVTDGLYINDGTVYNIFYFYEEGVNRYIATLNETAKRLKGTTNVYSILAPTNVILLDADTQKKIGGSDQTQALKYYASGFSDDVRAVYVGDILKKHRSEYLFFRTDHHWTADGAYYAYKIFCKEKGVEAHETSWFKKDVTYEPFLGSFYTELGDESLAENPDSVHAYIPNGTNEADTVTMNGSAIENKVVKDDDYNENNKYLSFLGGDHKLTTIVNDKVDDNTACLMICDSMGNAFAPFLVDHYHTTYVADFRYMDSGAINFCKNHNITDLIVLNSIKISSSNTTNDQLQVDLLGQ